MSVPRSIDLLDTRLRPLSDAILGAACVPGASVSVVVGDQAYHHAYGIKSVQSGEPVTPNTGFNIGSCSKAFVSATVAALVADGLVTWDDPISKWVPEFQLHDPRLTAMVTLRDLSANRLGLPRSGLVESGLDPRHPAEVVFERLRHTPSMYPFRDRFAYLNAGHSANAVAAGRITGQGFLNTLRDRILQPLGMAGTSGGAATHEALSDLAGWHVVIDGKAVAIDPVFSDQSLGSGGMVVSGRDALQWLRLHLDGGQVDGRQIIPREALLETHRPHAVARPGLDITSLFYPGAHMAAYALGWAVSDLEGHPLMAHSGNDLGASAMTLLLPRSGIGIAVYANSVGGGPGPVALAYALAGTLLGLKPRDWLTYFKSHTPTSLRSAAEGTEQATTLPLESYAGRFEHPADGPLDVRCVDGRLVCRLQDAYRFSATLVPAGAHRFTLEPDALEWKAAAAADASHVTFTVLDGNATKAELSHLFAGRPFLRSSAP